MDKDVLLPCAHCGCEADMYERKDYSMMRINCMNPKCGVAVEFYSITDVVHAWNQRSTPQERCELVKLDEKEVIKFFERTQSSLPVLRTELHCVVMARELCATFGTAPAQKTSYQEVESVMVNGVDFVPKSAQRSLSLDLLIKEYENEINIEKLSGNIVKEAQAKGIVIGLRMADSAIKAKMDAQQHNEGATK